MRALRRALAGLICLTLLTAAGCGAAVSVNSNGSASARGNLPPGQIVKETTPGHNK